MIGNQRHRGSPGRAALRIAFAALAAAAATTAAAVDFPHGDTVELANGCQDCHVAHKATLPNLQGPNMDCLSCHSANTFPLGGSWTSTNQSTMAGSGSSHNWSLSATNAPAGATPPTNAGMSAQLVGGALTCSVCHDPHTQVATPFDPTAPTLAGSAGRHYVRADNGNSAMCLDCHAAWAQSTEAERTYSATVNRSHPVAFQDSARTRPLTLAIAGSGNDPTYAQVPLDSPIKMSVVSATTSVITVDNARFKFATGALTGFVLRFTSGVYANVQARIVGNTLVTTPSVTETITIAALPTAPAAGVTFEVDRAGDADAYDVTTNAGTVANQIGDPAKSWPTSGELSPTGRTVTILATTSAMSSNVGKTCSIASNSATALTLAAGCLAGTPAGGTWAYRINWPTSARGTTTGAGSTTTFVDTTKTLFGLNTLQGLQVRFPGRKAAAQVIGWNNTTLTATLAATPAISTAIQAGEDYVLEPAQVPAIAGTAQSGATGSLTANGTPFAGLNLAGALVRFTKARNVANQGVVSRVTGNGTNTLNFTIMPAGVLATDAFEIDLDGNVTNNIGLGGTSGSATAGNVVCQSCHGVHMADSDASTYDDAPRTGDGHLLRRSPADTCGGCHQTGVHNSITTDSSYGAWGLNFTCQTCHQPHQTPNIYVVKQQIATPNSGTKFVTFQNTTGAAANSFATATNVVPAAGTSAGTAVEVCNACHTQTARARNNAATDWSTHFNGAKCTNCHTHDGGFSGSESKGAILCNNCHDFGMRTADATRQGTYHHVLEAAAVINASSQTTYPTNAAPVTDATVDKTCTQCHVDHPLFRPDLNSALSGAGRSNNLRTRIGNAPPSTANSQTGSWTPNDTSNYFGSTDYAQTGSPIVGGICISCHASSQTRDVTNQKAGDSSATTNTVPLADFSASAHAYLVTGTITNGSASFTVACTKCHNSDPAGLGYQSGTNGRRFALHTSADRRLRAPLGQTTLQDDHGEDFCWRCHSTFANASAIGGTAKPAASNDWYGTVTTMSAASEDIYNAFSRGSAGSVAGQPTSTTNTLYFKPTAQENPAEPMPNAHQTADAFAGGTWVGRAMSPFAPTAANEAQDTLSYSVALNTTYYQRVTFTSPPVATAVSMPAGTWTINVFDRESATGANARVRYRIYRWLANDTLGVDFVARATFGSEMSTNTAPGGLQTIAATGSAVSLAVGDKIVVDLEIEHNAVATASPYSATYYFGSTAQSNVVLPANVTFTYTSQAVSGSGLHDVGTYTGLHRANPALETGAYLATAKHVECEDCHDPHATRAGRHTKGSNVAGGVLFGAPAVQPTYNATSWQIATPITYTQTLVGAATPEAYVCFRCHSNSNTAIPNDPAGTPTGTWATGGGGFTNTALEFSTSNQSFHPVLGPLPAADTGGSSQLTANQLCNATSCAAQTGGFQTWTPGQTMTCSDCHTSEAGTIVAQGPHGSAVRYMLGGVNRAWPFQTAGATSGAVFRVTDSELNLGTANGLFCRNCHPAMGNSTYSNSLHQFANTTSHGSGANNFVACIGCHIRVPHGGKVSRLIVTPNAPARYKVAGQSQTMSAFTKGTRTSYSNSSGWTANSSTACTQSQHASSGTESW